jgi:hypothetical protein
MAIAGLEIGLPKDEAGLTADWVCAALHASGALPKDARVSGVAKQRIGEGVGMLSHLYRLRPTYEGACPDAPATLVAKLPTTDPTMRFLAGSLNAYGREVKFYREIAQGAPFASAACHAAAIDEASGDFALLLEDMGSLTPLDQINGISWAFAETACDTLADFHAGWSGDARLNEMAQTFWPLKNPVYPELLGSMFDGGWAIAKREMGDQLSPAMLRYGDNWRRLSMYCYDELSHRETLLHGDFRADNLFLDGGAIAALDFQIAMVGIGVYDLAYFVSQSLAPAERAGRDRELVARYIARMASHGITLDPEETWRRYRLSLAYCLIYPMAVFPSWDANNDRGRDLMRTLLTRCASAIEDTDALSCFPASAWEA